MFGKIKRVLDKVGSLGLEKIHFLHLGKNAGTEIGRYIDEINKNSNEFRVLKRAHDVFLKHLPREDRYFFSVRDPVSRFRSGFYSRKRKGQPRIYSEWSPYDRAAFESFEHANDLAESLFSSGELGRKAFGAMKSIRHTAQNQVDWFYCCGNFLEIRPPLAILRQEHLADDVLVLLRKLNVTRSIELEANRIKSHRNDYECVPDLSPLAVQNLHRWYAQDFEFYKICCDWIQNNAEL